MRGPLSVIRSGERRDALAALALLFGIMAAHSVLETARDALFLSRIPAERLPWMVLAIAFVSLALVRLQKRFGGRDRRRTLRISLSVAAGVTGAFYFLVEAWPEGSLYALYVWSGVLGTLVLVHFWMLLGDIFSVTQAKRLFPLVGAGGVAGAIAGSGAAAGLARVLRADQLVLLSAALLGVAALLGRFLTKGGHAEPAESAPTKGGWRGLDDARALFENVYARRILALLFVIATAVTVGDFLFKQTIAREVPAAELAETFGVLYLVLNVSSLGVQLLLVGFITRRFTVIGALAVLPLALGGSAAAMLVAPSLAAAFAIKGADGSLRYSLDKTARELLFVPLGAALRGRLKPLIDVLGGRGGRALASAGILALVAVGASDRVYAGVLLGLCVAGLLLVARLRGPYLALFRERLRYGSLAIERMEMDADAIEALVTALDSPDDQKVMVALEHLPREGRAHLVPALILHHPSEVVVGRALDLFADHGRTHALPVIRRIMATDSAATRAKAIAARAALEDDDAWLEAIAAGNDGSRVAEAVLLAKGALAEEEREGALQRLLDSGSALERVAFIRTVERVGARAFSEALSVLALDDDEPVCAAAGRAMGTLGDASHLPALIGMLGRESIRPVALDALRAHGEPGFSALAEALEDRALPKSVRWHLPAAMSALSPPDAARLLLAHLPEERDGMVRYRAIRALELIARDHPEVRFDRAQLDAAIAAAATRAFAAIEQHRVLREGVARDAGRKTTGHDLLVSMVESRRDNAVGRLLRLLRLLRPDEDFALIKRGLASDDAQMFSSSIELLENILRSPLREAVVALVDRIDDDARLAAGGAYYRPSGITGYEELLAAMLTSGSKVLSAAAAHHVGELRLSSLEHELSSLADDPDLAPDVAWSRARLTEAGAIGA